MANQQRLTERLREFRKKSGLTQTDVAGRLGLHYMTVSAWERGVSIPSDDNFDQLSALYGVPVAELRYGPGEMSSPGVISGSSQRRDDSRVRSQPMRVAMHSLLAELAPILTEEDEIFVRDTFARAEQSIMPHGGHEAREPSASDLETEANAVTVGLRAWANERHKRRHE